DCSSLVRFGRSYIFARVGLLGLPNSFLIDFANSAAQSSPHPDSTTELTGEFAEKVAIVSNITACSGDLMTQNLREREMLKQSDDVRKPFVKREHIWIRRVQEGTAHSIQQRMGGLVRDDVVRQAGKHHTARHVIGRVILTRSEIPEKKRNFLGSVISVSLAQRVRIDPQARNKNRIILGTFRRVGARAPKSPSPEAVLKVINGQTGDRICHLLMKLWRAFGWGQAVLG